MSSTYITLNLQLEILPNNKVLVPGCEPTSALTSNKLSAWLSQFGCDEGALVNVKDVLEAIPGSFVKYGANFNRGNRRQTWLVFPPIDLDCPCRSYDDWYAILKSLPKTDLTDEELKDCANNDMGYCPSPDFNEVPAPPKDPYKNEGDFPPGVGVLPPLPPWSK
jgi:hypothetical protein